MQTKAGTIAAEPASTTDHGRNDRLAELVVHLSDCPAPAAVAAVNAATGDTVPTTAEERLEVVARALVSVRRHIDLRE